MTVFNQNKLLFQLKREREKLVYQTGKMLDNARLNHRDLWDREEAELAEMMKQIDLLTLDIGDGLTSALGVRGLEARVLGLSVASVV